MQWKNLYELNLTNISENALENVSENVEQKATPKNKLQSKITSFFNTKR